MMQLGFSIALTMQQSGGGAAPSAPVVVIAPSIIAQPLVGVPVEMDEGLVTGATSTTYQWYRGAPTTTPISGAIAAGYAPVDADYSLTLYRRTTYTNAAGSTVVDVAAPGITGARIVNDWSALTIGDNTAAILTKGYGRSSGPGTQYAQGVAVAETKSPSGKSVSVSAGSADQNLLYKSESDTFFGTNAWSTFYEDLHLIKQIGTGRFHARGKMVPATTGVWDFAAGFSVRFQYCYHQLPGEDPNDGAGTYLATLTAGEYYFIRHRMTGTSSQIKVWGYGNPEPDAWDSTRTHGSALVGRGPGCGSRTTEAAQTFVWSSCGGNTTAPLPVGYVDPPPSSSDLMTYAASSAGTSVTQNNSAIVYTVGDI